MADEIYFITQPKAADTVVLISQIDVGDSPGSISPHLFSSMCLLHTLCRKESGLAGD
jgi:hypothetical protein